MIKKVLKRFVPGKLKEIYKLYKNTRPLAERECPICGYHGYFSVHGRPVRVDAKCKECGSSERHRLFWLWFRQQNYKLQEPVIHFAAEKTLEKQFRQLNIDYRTADLFRSADLVLNMENIALPDDSVGTIICNHVLEHVNDKVAMAELYRVLKSGGKLICSVPIVEGWEKTYEDATITEPYQKELHYGQYDHVRFYGKDFRERLADAGFFQEEYTADGAAVVKYRLIRGEKIFICQKERIE